ncbi:DUF1572 family protein [Lacipirellula parvula]|uniref:DUF1572 domain-containing protein n=1 Tax=Lacipirellula parvula TaxID=2650471 RepID=A0A5K7XDE9_9BACT|nr:DUF1572 family protein [Lacipirellula parvula]BBO34770.1 hypothetical protein PLANPX_4382 [Lacipirellula parvula]
MDSSAVALHWLEATQLSFQYHKSLADRAIVQVSDEALHRTLDAETNSIALIVQHLSGNLASRWTDFLTSDGEKPWRNRDREFVDANVGRAELLATWDAAWNQLFTTLAALSPTDLERTVAVRGESHSVPLAIQRSLAHASYHVGQIVILARHWAGEQWTTLTIPRGGSAAYNEQSWGSASFFAPGSARG